MRVTSLMGIKAPCRHLVSKKDTEEDRLEALVLAMLLCAWLRAGLPTNAPRALIPVFFPACSANQLKL